MTALAAPLVVAELGWIAMGVVDTMMVGRLPNSAVAIGGVSLGGIVYYTCTTYGWSILLGLDTMVSQSFGAGKIQDCHKSLWSAMSLTCVLLPIMVVANLLVITGLPAFGVNPQVAPVAASYSRILNWGTMPLLLYFVLERYLQSMGLAKPVMFALVSANIVNFAGNWILMFGHFGLRALGTDGSAWSTSMSRLYMAAVLFGALIYFDRRRGLGLFRVPPRPEWERVVRLLKLGFPAATHVFLEIAIFGVATALIAQLDPTSLAGHQIALLVASVTFMVPLGISSAAAVRVGHAIGRTDAEGASRAGWTAIALGVSFMACSAVTMTTLPREIASLYTDNERVIASSAALLRIAAVFQLFDACQIIAAGALRGAGDTRTPMLCNLFFYWFIGLPLGYFLCFHAKWGAPGLWVGLCVALVMIGSALLAVWRIRIRDFGTQLNRAAAAGTNVL